MKLSIIIIMLVTIISVIKSEETVLQTALANLTKNLIVLTQKLNPIASQPLLPLTQPNTPAQELQPTTPLTKINQPSQPLQPLQPSTGLTPVKQAESLTPPLQPLKPVTSSTDLNQPPQTNTPAQGINPVKTQPSEALKPITASQPLQPVKHATSLTPLKPSTELTPPIQPLNPVKPSESLTPSIQPIINDAQKRLGDYTTGSNTIIKELNAVTAKMIATERDKFITLLSNYNTKKIFDEADETLETISSILVQKPADTLTQKQKDSIKTILTALTATTNNNKQTIDTVVGKIPKFFYDENLSNPYAIMGMPAEKLISQDAIITAYNNAVATTDNKEKLDKAKNYLIGMLPINNLRKDYEGRISAITAAIKKITTDFSLPN